MAPGRAGAVLSVGERAEPMMPFWWVAWRVARAFREGYVPAMTATKPWMRHAGMVASETTETHARLFWSGDCQAVRLPRGMCLPGSKVVVRREGKTLVLEPLAEAGDWGGFWDRLVSLDRPIHRRKVRSGPRRRRR